MLFTWRFFVSFNGTCSLLQFAAVRAQDCRDDPETFFSYGGVSRLRSFDVLLH